MNSVGFAANGFAGAVRPVAPPSGQAVSLENSDTKQDSAAAIANNDGRAAAETKQQADKAEQRRQAVEDQQLIRRLSARDAEVRAHEAAHASVGGQFAGPANFSFQRGPDGIDYAVGGEVRISVPSGGPSPESTLQALQQVRAAALAPASPSEQDRQVAAQAARQAAELRAQIDSHALEQDQQKLEQAVAEREAKAEQKQRDEEQRLEARQQDEQRLARQQLERRNAQLSAELITLDNLERRNAGSLLNQFA